LKDETYILGYHTQEFREESQALSVPILCVDKDVWLGEGYYFWRDIEYAHYWGIDKKKRTGYYDIYSIEIDQEFLLDTVFNEDDYEFFKDSIEKAIKKLKIDRKDYSVTINEVHTFLKRNVWNEFEDIEGIVFEDIPIGKRHSQIPPLYYKKRIQIVVFDLRITQNFSFYKEKVKCNEKKKL